MTSVQPLREFIRERLTAAAEEIFSQVEKTIVQYEEEIDRQRRLLDLTWRPRTVQNPADFQQHFISKRKEVLIEPLLSNQERLSGLEEPEPEALHEEPKSETLHEDPEAGHEEPEALCEVPESLQIKEEPDDVYKGQDEEQLHLKQETETFMVSHTDEERDDSNLEPSDDPVLSETCLEADEEDQEGLSHNDLSCNEEQKQRGKCWRSSKSRRDEKTHLNQNLYSCKMCSKAFTQKGSLTKHLRVHTGGNPFTCLSCGRSFRKHFSLIVHMRIHTGEKPFPCLICGKSFCQRGNLNVHMRTHTGEKPFPCLTCGKHFQRKSNLTAHMRIHKRNVLSECGVGKELL